MITTEKQAREVQGRRYAAGLFGVAKAVRRCRSYNQAWDLPTHRKPAREKRCARKDCKSHACGQCSRFEEAGS